MNKETFRHLVLSRTLARQIRNSLNYSHWLFKIMYKAGIVIIPIMTKALLILIEGLT